MNANNVNNKDEDDLIIHHFNDVYHINQPDLLARFSHAIRAGSLIVFSGDAFAPSLESSVLKGKHMVPVLNHLSVSVACYGNHDFDFGETRLRELSASCNFPWLLSNAFNCFGDLLASAKEYVVQWHSGYKIGFLGLAGSDWPSNCQHLPFGAVIADPIQTARRVARHLREHVGVDLVIAITHMRLQEDIQVSNACQAEIDLILGGHDHDIVAHGSNITLVNDTAEGHVRVVKSGTDFRNYGVVRLSVSRTPEKCLVTKVKVRHERDLMQAAIHDEDKEMHHIVANAQELIAQMSSSALFRTACPLEGRFNVIRTGETNLGNLLADVVRAYYATDIAFINSGSVRCDRIIPEGICYVRDVIDILPFDNAFVVRRVSSRALLTALENSVSDSRTDGRFLQISGLSIIVNLHNPEGSRILSATLENSGKKIASTDKGFFTIAMVEFIARGFDGYTCLAGTETLVDTENAMTDTSLMISIFREQGARGACNVSEEMTERARTAVVSDFQDGLPVVKPLAAKQRITFAERN